MNLLDRYAVFGLTCPTSQGKGTQNPERYVSRSGTPMEETLPVLGLNLESGVGECKRENLVAISEIMNHLH